MEKVETEIGQIDMLVSLSVFIFVAALLTDPEIPSIAVRAVSISSTGVSLRSR